jgi:hypothetical protein
VKYKKRNSERVNIIMDGKGRYRQGIAMPRRNENGNIEDIWLRQIGNEG